MNKKNIALIASAILLPGGFVIALPWIAKKLSTLSQASKKQKEDHDKTTEPVEASVDEAEPHQKQDDNTKNN